MVFRGEVRSYFVILSYLGNRIDLGRNFVNRNWDIKLKYLRKIEVLLDS